MDVMQRVVETMIPEAQVHEGVRLVCQRGIRHVAGCECVISVVPAP